MLSEFYQPIYCFSRANTPESIIHGAIAVVDSKGNLIAHYGSPDAVTFLRSSAKPFQTIPLVENGGLEAFQITPRQLAVTCASHSGTDRHVRNIVSLQRAIGIHEEDLLCGTHPPFHLPTRRALRDRGEEPGPNRHNCSGKHTGMLGQTVLKNADPGRYLHPDHPVQQEILAVIADLCEVDQNKIQLGTDGCSVPTFAMPLKNAALGWARLFDPVNLMPGRAAAVNRIVSAMTAHPYQVAGPGRLDTQLMKVTGGRILAKSGAEAFQALALRAAPPLEASRPWGVALKIADGDPGKRVKERVVIEVLLQLNALNKPEIAALSEFKPETLLLNQRNLEVGEGKPCFQLIRN